MMGKLLNLALKHPLELVIGLLLVALGTQTLRLRASQAHVRELGFDKLAIQAAADTSRELDAQEKAALTKLYGDSLQGVERLIVQEKQQNTALGKALGQQTKLSADLAVMVRALQAKGLEGTVVAIDSNDVRRSSFAIDSTPYHVRIAVALPPAPRHGILDSLGIQLDKARINAHAGCLPKNADGLRPASLTLTGPKWLTLELGELTQDRENCNPDKPSAGLRLKHDAVMTGLGAGAVVLLRLLKIVP